MKTPAFDLSPIKKLNDLPPAAPSSSPVPARKLSVTSPTKSVEAPKQEAPNVELEDEDQGFDLTR